MQGIIMSLNEKHIKGIRAELLAQEYFVDKGYKVFRALHGVGPIDFITLDNEKFKYFSLPKTQTPIFIEPSTKWKTELSSLNIYKL